jgi:hypothetical protein
VEVEAAVRGEGSMKRMIGREEGGVKEKEVVE